MEHLKNFISMVKSANIDFEQQDYVADGEQFTDVQLFDENSNPTSCFTFDNKGELVEHSLDDAECVEVD